MAALTGCIQTNAQIYLDISDALSCSENITDCVYINFVQKYSKMQPHLTAAAIELQDKQTQSARQSLSVREFRASNSTAFQTV